LLVKADSEWYKCGECAGRLYFTYPACAKCGAGYNKLSG
jgi:hypothetical protein